MLIEIATHNLVANNAECLTRIEALLSRMSGGHGDVEHINKRLSELEYTLERGLKHIMAQNDDLKTAVARVGASTSAEIKAVSDKLSAIGSDNPVVADAIASLNATADTLDAETATLTAAAPAPTPAPAPPTA